jgi:hypothetical protein
MPVDSGPWIVDYRGFKGKVHEENDEVQITCDALDIAVWEETLPLAIEAFKNAVEWVTRRDATY